MSTVNMCRLCLAMNAPVRVIAGSPFQDIYEKLTGVSLNTPYRPVVACYMCYSQLNKCYNLMVRSMRADKVLTLILQKGEIVYEEFVAMTNKYQLADSLSVTTTESINITSTEHGLIKEEIIHEPLSSQSRGEMETGRRTLLDRLKFEESEDEGETERAVPEDKDDIDSKGLIDMSTDQGLIKEIKEKPLSSQSRGEIKKGRRTLLDRLKFEESDDEGETERAVPEDMDNIDSKGLIDMSSEHSLIKEIKEKPLSSQSRGEMETGRRTLLDRLKFEESDDEGETERAVLEDMDDIDSKGLIDMSTDHGLIKEIKEKPLSSWSRGEMKKGRRTLLDRLKFEESDDEAETERAVPEDMDDIDSKGLIDMSTEHGLLKEIIEEPLSSQSRGEREKGRQTLLDRLQFEESEDEGEIERAVPEDMDDIYGEGLIDKEDMKQEVLEQAMNVERHELACEDDMKLSELKEVRHVEGLIHEDGTRQEELEGAQVIEGDECEDVAPSNKCNKTQDKNVQRRLRKRRAVLEEDTSRRNTGSYMLRSTKKAANKRQVSRNSICSDTTINKGDVSVNSDNDSTSTNTDVDNSSSEHLTDMFICNDCGNVFDDKYLLIEHIEHHNVVKRTSNRTSGEESSHQRTVLRKQTCSRTGVVNKHTETHSGNNIIECGICQRTFATKGNLKTHLRIHTGEKPFECEICQVKFNQKSNLKQHLRIHTGEKPFECEICKVKFTYKSNLKIHLKIHTGEKKSFEREICQIKFFEKSYLKKHLRIHTGEKPFECEICKVKFNYKSNLKIHLRIHTGEKPFECEICQVKFSQKSSLKQHLRIHTGEKPFECEICQHKFFEKSNLKKHLRIHTGEKPFECEICQIKFNKTSSLKTHFRIHTGEKLFGCEICQVKFKQKSHLKDHLRIHTGEKPFKCEICQQRFKWRSTFSVHFKSHTRVRP